LTDIAFAIVLHGCDGCSLEARIPDRSSAIRASGLTPEKFGAAERDFRTAVQAVSTASAQALSGPSDAATSAFAASLGAAPTPNAARPSPLAKSAVATGTSQEALLAKAQAVQAGSLFDRTMRSAPGTSPSKTPSRAAATPLDTNDAATLAQQGSASNGASAEQCSATRAAGIASELRPRRLKRRRMAKVVFGLAVHSSLNRLNNEHEASDERVRRLRINEIQATIGQLRSGKPSWRYLDAPGDFLVAISAPQDGAGTSS
jgi:hypothetical protein